MGKLSLCNFNNWKTFELFFLGNEKKLVFPFLQLVTRLHRSPRVAVHRAGGLIHRPIKPSHLHCCAKARTFPPPDVFARRKPVVEPSHRQCRPSGAPCPKRNSDSQQRIVSQVESRIGRLSVCLSQRQDCEALQSAARFKPWDRPAETIWQTNHQHLEFGRKTAPPAALYAVGLARWEPLRPLHRGSD